MLGQTGRRQKKPAPGSIGNAKHIERWRLSRGYHGLRANLRAIYRPL
jgi:hypothetical protein